MKQKMQIVALLCVGIAIWGSQAARAAQPFTVAIETDGDLISNYMQFGFTATSTDDYDQDVDWPAPPANLDGNTIYFVGNTVNRLAKDFKELGDSKTWELKVVLEGNDKSTTMSWNLDSGDLDGNVLQLKDKDTGAVLIEDMMTTTSIDIATTSTFLIVYGAANQPPVARDDEVWMMRRDGSILVDVLANDYDPDGNPISIAGFTQPAAGGTVSESGGKLQYDVPDPLPAEWTGTVTFDYQISDAGGRATATGTVTIEVVEAVLVLPVADNTAVKPGEDLPVSYTIQRDDAVDALTIVFDMPHVPDPDTPGDVIYWTYVAGSVSLDESRAVPTAVQADGELTITFDSIPADGSTLSFSMTAPPSAVNDVENFGGIVQYSVDGAAQPDEDIPGRELKLQRANLDIDNSADGAFYDLVDLTLLYNYQFAGGKFVLGNMVLNTPYVGDDAKAAELKAVIEGMIPDLDLDGSGGGAFYDLVDLTLLYNYQFAGGKFVLGNMVLNTPYVGDDVKAAEFKAKIEDMLN